MSIFEPQPPLPRALKSLENVVVLYLVQAMLGQVPAEVEAIAVDVRDDGMTLHVVAASRTSIGDDSFTDALEDIVVDLEALLDSEALSDRWLIEVQVSSGLPDETWPGSQFRRVFEKSRERRLWRDRSAR